MEFIFEVLIPSLIAGGCLIFFNKEIANFFKEIKSTNLIRGLDNPWTFKTLGFIVIFLYPIYQWVLLNPGIFL